MPALTAVAVDPGLYPLFSDVYLLADVPITPINTFVDVITFGTLQPGTYLVSGEILLTQITGAAEVTYKVLQGATVVKMGEVLEAIGNSGLAIPTFELTLLAAAVVKIQLASTVLTSTAKSVAPDNGAGSQNFVSQMLALRIG